MVFVHDRLRPVPHQPLKNFSASLSTPSVPHQSTLAEKSQKLSPLMTLEMEVFTYHKVIRFDGRL